MRQSSSHGLQHLIESKAAPFAFLVTAACVMTRGATMWSGGAFTIAGILGAVGLRWYNGVTGVGIAIGAELLTSVFGRQWLRAQAELHEAAGRPGLRKSERQALLDYHAFHARISLGFMVVGILASIAAAFLFLLQTTEASGLAIVGEAVIAATLVTVMTAFGVFYRDAPTADASEKAVDHARAIRSDVVGAAGRRLQDGTFTPQDVRLVARALPRAEREKFEAALLVDSPDDPMWNVAQLAEWLGWTDDTGRRRITRRLAKLTEAGMGIIRDDRRGYRIPQSAVVRCFSEDYIREHAKQRTLPRQSQPSGTLAAVPTSDTDPTPTGSGQPQEYTLAVS